MKFLNILYLLFFCDMLTPAIPASIPSLGEPVFVFIRFQNTRSPTYWTGFHYNTVSGAYWIGFWGGKVVYYRRSETAESVLVRGTLVQSLH